MANAPTNDWPRLLTDPAAAEVTEAAAAASLSSSHSGHFADGSDNRGQTRDESVVEEENRVALSSVTEGRRETLRRRGDLESH